jgi:hypothetical protein
VWDVVKSHGRLSWMMVSGDFLALLLQESCLRDSRPIYS